MSSTRPSDDDRALLERIQSGDDHAMELVYDRYAGVVYSVAYRVLGDSDLAEQVLSSIFLEIWRSPQCLGAFAGSLSFLLAMIARSRAVGLQKHTQAPAISDWAANFRGWNTREDAFAAIAQLPEQRRVMLERVFFDGTISVPRSEDLLTGTAVAHLAGTGVEMADTDNNPAFASRKLHVRDVVSHINGMNRVARVFVDNPTAVLQELVNAAVELCGADSAGISIVEENSTEENYFHWVAVAGQYSGFYGFWLPRYPSPCSVALERGRPQVYSVSQKYFDLMHVEAPTVTDGLLIPWSTEETEGTIWILAHGREEAFDPEDCRMMQALANFAATGVRLQQQQKMLMEQARASGETAMASRLAHQINNPLQGLMQTVFLFGRGGAESDVFAQQAMKDISGLSDLVKGLLTVPGSQS